MRYARPVDVRDAIVMLAAGGTPLAGGTVVAANVAAGRADDAVVIDIGRLPELAERSSSSAGLRLGALTTLDRIASTEDESPRFAALAQAAASVGNPNVRRAGTIGGNIVQGGDLMPAL